MVPTGTAARAKYPSFLSYRAFVRKSRRSTPECARSSPRAPSRGRASLETRATPSALASRGDETRLGAEVRNEGADETHGSLGSGETRGDGAPQAAREWRVDASREDARRRASDLAAGDIARARQTVRSSDSAPRFVAGCSENEISVEAATSRFPPPPSFGSTSVRADVRHVGPREEGTKVPEPRGFQGAPEHQACGARRRRRGGAQAEGVRGGVQTMRAKGATLRFLPKSAKPDNARSSASTASLPGPDPLSTSICTYLRPRRARRWCGVSRTVSTRACARARRGTARRAA